ncbi:MAG: hypothetical protein ACXADY_10165 [Candidatus Hodarchaeales archaeon]|jgi:hypothetical protein
MLQALVIGFYYSFSCIFNSQSISSVHTEDDFNNRILNLAKLIAEIETRKERAIVENKVETQKKISGSINIMEAFLDLNHPGYDNSIILNFRNINTLRSKKAPIHDDEGEWTRALRYFGFEYPLDWEDLWIHLLKKFLESLKS